ncbi:unclassified [Brachyspira pilosicoli WesB]|uniref:Unclassified n=1 Tax=Brachyspira pilosicoli WesB TaxID=1161918 RepID=K0JIE3_BRAPL|nr:hypothetical protein [Brachyspira pilosicoli]CCG57988.1 unclassified [Brachyspira pilosicoli WesB]
MEKTNKKRKKTGGRQKGTPNKISKKIANNLIKEYFFEASNLKTGETERFNALIIELEKLALYSEKEIVKIKAIDIIFKSLGIYDNKTNIDIDNNNNINIKVEYK